MNKWIDNNHRIVKKIKTIFISGSTQDYTSWPQQETREFLHPLSGSLISRGYRIITGVGLGVGEAVITGAIEEIYRNNWRVDDWLILRPFPQKISRNNDRQAIWEAYRQECIPKADICLVLFGNKRQEGEIVGAAGVMREYEIAKAHGLQIVPVGGTGYAAREIQDEMLQHFDEYYPSAGPELKEKFNRLGQKPERLADLRVPVLEFLSALD